MGCSYILIDVIITTLKEKRILILNCDRTTERTNPDRPTRCQDSTRQDQKDQRKKHQIRLRPNKHKQLQAEQDISPKKEDKPELLVGLDQSSREGLQSCYLKTHRQKTKQHRKERKNNNSNRKENENIIRGPQVNGSGLTVNIFIIIMVKA